MNLTQGSMTPMNLKRDVSYNNWNWQQARQQILDMLPYVPEKLAF